MTYELSIEEFLKLVYDLQSNETTLFPPDP